LALGPIGYISYIRMHRAAGRQGAYAPQHQQIKPARCATSYSREAVSFIYAFQAPSAADKIGIEAADESGYIKP